MQLRPHQTEVIKLSRQAIGSGYKRPLIFAPCSFGKTIIAAEIARLAVEKGNKVLFLVHRRLLCIQTKEKFDAYGLHSSIIMAGEEADFSSQVMITTIQTYSRRLDLNSPEANLFFHDAAVIFCDEAHLGISPTYKKIYSFYQDRVIIGLTGSPARGDQRGLGEVFDTMVSSVGIQTLTEKGFLVPVRYFAAETPDLSGVNTVAGDYNKGQLQKKMNQNKLVGDVIENWLKVAEGRPTIVFSSGVKHSIHLKEKFEKHGVAAAHLDSRSPHEDRLRVLDKFRRGDLTVVTNCQLFTEGYDADFVSCIAIARPTKSLPLWIQMAGRGQRIFEGKQDCILLDFGGNVERHGFLTDPIQWSLDGKEKAWSKKPIPKDKRPVKCAVCHAIFEGVKICPDCGSPVRTFGRKIETTDAELKELNGKKKATMADKRRFYGMLLTLQMKKGYKDGWLAWKYKERFKVWPRGMDGVAPIVADKEFQNWMTYQRIKYAKRRKAA